MPSFSQNLQGRNVYGGGSFAPTKGRVSAQGMQGYLRRESRNNRGIFGGVSRIGGDGQSDTRSGMAQAAMARRAGGTGTTRPINGWREQYGAGGPGRQNVKPGKGNKPTPDKPSPTAGGGAVGVTPTVSTPTVVVNDAGQLELPYSPAWSQDLLENLGDYNADLADIQSQQQQQALLYSQQKRQAEQGYEIQKRNTLNDNSARGTAFSSGYGVSVGNDSRDFNNLLGGIESENAALNQDFDAQKTAIIAAFKDQLAQGSLDYANSLTEGAGTFGYGSIGEKISSPGVGGRGGKKNATPAVPAGYQWNSPWNNSGSNTATKKNKPKKGGRNPYASPGYNPWSNR